MGRGGRPLRVLLVKPSKYAVDGFVERFRRGFMPNSTLWHLASLTPQQVDGHPCEVVTVDEYVRTDLGYLDLLAGDRERRTLLALVGAKSHQYQRALDLWEDLGRGEYLGSRPVRQLRHLVDQVLTGLREGAR